MSTSADCLFCRIVRREIPANEVLRDEHVVAFHDLNPVAPTHVLIVPTVHATNVTEFVGLADAASALRLFGAAAEIGARFSSTGFRVVTNEGVDAGQSVAHLHLHVLAGRALHWPPG